MNALAAASHDVDTVFTTSPSLYALPPTSAALPEAFTMSNLAPSSVASPCAAAPALESCLASLSPPLRHEKLMSTCVAGPVLMEKVSNPVETSPARAFTLAHVSPRSSDLAHFSNWGSVPKTAASRDPW